jgi:hypothetical protein
MNGWRIDASTRISFTASAISFFCIFEMSMRLHAYLRQLRSARARGGGVAASPPLFGAGAAHGIVGAALDLVDLGEGALAELLHRAVVRLGHGLASGGGAKRYGGDATRGRRRGRNQRGLPGNGFCRVMCAAVVKI